MAKLTAYTMPAETCIGDDYAANLSHFLMANGQSIFGKVSVKIKAADQRALFGRFLGKGSIFISGETEELSHWVKVAFGQDIDCTEKMRWGDL
jgi:hypothetical protein